MTLTTKAERISLQLFDVFALIAALSFSGVLENVTGLGAALRYGLVLLLWALAAQRFGVYRDGRNLRHRLTSLLEAWVVTMGVGALASLIALENLGLGAVGAFGIALAAAIFVRAVVARLPRELSERPHFLIVGSCPSLEGIATALSESGAFRVAGYVHLPGEPEPNLPGLPHLGGLEDLRQIIVDKRIRTIVLCPSESAVTGHVQEVIHLCDEAAIEVQYYPSFLELESLRVTLTWQNDRPGLSLNAPPNATPALVTKRTMDLIGAVAGIALVAPVMLVCASLVWLHDRGPILYRQTRVGRNGHLFTCLKFRTMVQNADGIKQDLSEDNEQDGPAFKIKRDPRITPIGRFLRKYSMDELPQLFNVLVGDMSLVGPRPPVPAEVQQYDWWQRRRLSVRPGLTCIWQVWGRNAVSFKRWVEMDLYYIDNWSLWMDVKLIAHTVRCVTAGTGM